MQREERAWARKNGRKRGKGEGKREWGIWFPLTVCLGSTTCSPLRFSHCGTSSTPGCLFLLLGPTCCGLVEARKQGQSGTISTAHCPQAKEKHECSQLSMVNIQCPFVVKLYTRGTGSLTVCISAFYFTCRHTAAQHRIIRSLCLILWGLFLKNTIFLQNN